MKKLLILIISILSLSFLFGSNKVYAQEPTHEYYNYMMLVPFNIFLESAEYDNTYEFYVYYTVYNRCINEINQNEYFLISNIGFIKGFNRNTNSYELNNLVCSTSPITRTSIILKITVLKDYAYDNYNYPENDENIKLLFSRDSALYIRWRSLVGGKYADYGYFNGFKESFNIGYNNGYNIGYIKGDTDGYSDAGDLTYEEGQKIGYDDGFKEGYFKGVEAADKETARQMGYNDGYNDRRFNFVSNIHIWLIPAIILVFSISIYISYRKERNYNE